MSATKADHLKAIRAIIATCKTRSEAITSRPAMYSLAIWLAEVNHTFPTASITASP